MPRDTRVRRWQPLLLGLSLVPLLGILVALQAHWLGDLAAAQHEVTRRMLETAAKRMVSELQATLAEVEESVRAGPENLDGLAAALILEVVPLAAGENPPLHLPGFVVQGGRNTRSLVVLDVDRLEAELFPALARSALGADGLDTYRVSVVRVDGDGPALYCSHAEDLPVDEPPDASAELWLLPNRWQVFLGENGGDWTEVDGPVWVAAGEPLGSVGRAPAPWRIELRHRAGSLEVALAQARRRNLLLAGGLLALVVAGLALLWVAEQRGRRLAEKELAFVAGVSHELRTPIAVVRTAASNLRRAVVTEPARVVEYGELIEREATRLSGLVERVLRFSDEDTPLVLDEVDVEAIILAAVERCQPWRDRKRFEVAIDVAEDARTVSADGAALTSALHNLIENAIKYGDEGQTIRVRAWRGEDLVVEVADTGPGVAAQDREQLFDPFYRGVGVRGGNIPGSGLGLGVARDIAHAHGGRLELLEHDDGARGATFAFRLPGTTNGSSG